MKAVRYHTDLKWLHLYITRWLKAPMQMPDGSLSPRDRGTPQGGVISPLLANIFLHHAFDKWMERMFPNVPFERYADDAITHCTTKEQATEVLEAIRVRLKECGLELHPEKTRIVYCKDADRKGSHEYEKFDFLGFTFRPRMSKSRYGKFFTNFTPAIGDKAIKRIKKEIRSWQIHLRSDKELDDLASMFNPKVQGWINYYGKFYISMMYPYLRNIEFDLIRWAMRKYKGLRRHRERAKFWLGRVARREPRLFAHWKLGLMSPPLAE
jgi:RNA-directed DNA polymerase